MTADSRALVIGLGNLHAGDDAAGRLVARALAQRGGNFDLVEASGEAGALIALFEGRDDVVIVDACRAGEPAGTILRIDPRKDPLPGGKNSPSSHGIGLAEALALAPALGVMPARVEIYAIAGKNFTPGAGLSEPVAKAVPCCAEMVMQRSQVMPDKPGR